MNVILSKASSEVAVIVAVVMVVMVAMVAMLVLLARYIHDTIWDRHRAPIMPFCV